MSLVTLPRENLGFFPTPLHELVGLSKALKGPRIFAKREDTTGLYAGGNKTRNLEFLLADLKHRGVDTIITSAHTPSPTCVQLAAAARKLNMNVGFVFYGGHKPDVQGNLLLHKILGSRMKTLSGDLVANVDKESDNMAQEFIAMGHKPEVISFGANPHADNLKVLAWVDGAEELYNQLQAKKISAQYVVVAVGSCGTLAGLTLGLKLLKSSLRCVGISTMRHRGEDIRLIAEKANAAAKFMGWNVGIMPKDITIYDSYFGEGYGIVTQGCLEAIKLLARTEAIVLDPVYSGKAMAGLIDLTRKGVFTSEDTVIFIHTGGFPSIFAYDKELISSCED